MFGPLVRLEADYDRAMKEAQARTGVTVRWDRGLNQRLLARFVFPKEENELRLTTGGPALSRPARLQETAPSARPPGGDACCAWQWQLFFLCGPCQGLPGFVPLRRATCRRHRSHK